MSVDYFGTNREGIGIFVYSDGNKRVEFYGPISFITPQDPYDKPVVLRILRLPRNEVALDSQERAKIKNDIQDILKNAPLSLPWRGDKAINNIIFPEP